MWETTDNNNLTTRKFSRPTVVPYTAAEWLNERGRTPIDLRVWLEYMTRTEGNLQEKYWELLLDFSMVAAQMDPNYKNRSVLSIEVEPVTATDLNLWKWEDQRLNATLGTRTKIFPVNNRSGT